MHFLLELVFISFFLKAVALLLISHDIHQLSLRALPRVIDKLLRAFVHRISVRKQAALIVQPDKRVCLVIVGREEVVLQGQPELLLLRVEDMGCWHYRHLLLRLDGLRRLLL